MAADQAAWRLSAGDSEVQPPAETFLAKLRRLFMGRAGQRQKRHRHQTKQYQCKCCELPTYLIISHIHNTTEFSHLFLVLIWVIFLNFVIPEISFQFNQKVLSQRPQFEPNIIVLIELNSLYQTR